MFCVSVSRFSRQVVDRFHHLLDQLVTEPTQVSRDRVHWQPEETPIVQPPPTLKEIVRVTSLKVLPGTVSEKTVSHWPRGWRHQILCVVHV